MKIGYIGKANNIQQKQIQDSQNDKVGKSSISEAGKQYSILSKVDSAKISKANLGVYDDKRLAMAKSSILYDVSVEESISNSDKIASLTTQIAQGAYHVPSDTLANSILND